MYLSDKNICYLVPNDLSPKGHLSFTGRKQIVFFCGRKQIGVMRGKRLTRVIDIDVVVDCCHGRCGEDGMVAALAELCGVPVVGSDIISSAVTMDKIFTKNSLSALKLPTLRYVSVNRDFDADTLDRIEKLGFPVIVKPATLGSSIGISLCRTREELAEGLRTAFQYDERVLCEKALTNFYELNCSVMRVEGAVRTSVVESPISTGEILSFFDKYQRGEKFQSQSRVIPEKVEKKVVALTRRIFEDFSLRGVVRIDFLVDSATEKVYVNEINSIPGSLAYGLWQNIYSPQQFGSVLLKQAQADFMHRDKLVTSFESNVLKNSAVSKK